MTSTSASPGASDAHFGARAQHLALFSASILFPVAALALLAVAVVNFPYAALQDFPEWIYQGYVFNKLAVGGSSPLFDLKHYPVPYSLLQWLVSAVLLVVPPMAASKAIVALYGLVSIVVVRKVLDRNRIAPSIGWPILLSVAILNAPFWNGFMGYQSGVLVVLFFLTLPREQRSDWRFVLPFSLLAFFAHGWGFVALLAFIGAYALYDRRIWSCGAALLPSLALLAVYEKHNTIGKMWAVFDLSDVNPIVYKIYTLLKLAPYHNPVAFDFNAAAHFGWPFVGMGLALDAAFLLAALTLAVIAVRRLGWRAILFRPEMLAGAGLLILALALPPTMADWGNPGERLMIPAMIALTLALFSGFDAPPSAERAVLGAALLGGVALLAVGLVAAGRAYDNDPLQNVVAPEGAAATGAKANWFGHRLTQFDAKMKHAESAWRADAMPSLPLDFETGLLVAKKP
ncbi:hypothetical protein [Rhodoblastus sp.]|uniref:hypothetical protein n=1 Tax=Rhodoblastus sp. TaxID=1962975 RepID=UPI0035AF2695